MKVYGCLAIVIAALDQFIKQIVRDFPLGESFFDVPGILSLMHCINTGAAFSLLSGYTPVLAALSVGLIVIIGVYAGRQLHLTDRAQAALACLIGGGIGNFVDRLIYGGVTDYICLRFIEFPVFNLADIVITVSISALLILLFTDTLEEHSEDNHGSKD